MWQTFQADVCAEFKALNIEYDAELRGRSLAIKKTYLILCTLFAFSKDRALLTMDIADSNSPKRQRLGHFASFSPQSISLTPHTVSRIFGVAAASSFALLTVVSGYSP